ncbi:hypothetical protein ACVBEQ_10975 [Nakamurella sp. GG22]
MHRPDVLERVPAKLQYAAGLVGFFHGRLELLTASTAPSAKISDPFTRAVHRFAESEGIPWVDFVKGERKDDVLNCPGSNAPFVRVSDRPVLTNMSVVRFSSIGGRRPSRCMSRSFVVPVQAGAGGVLDVAEPVEHQQQGRLNHPVHRGGDAEPAEFAAVRFGDQPFPHRQRGEGAGLQLLPNLPQKLHDLVIFG